MTQDEIIAMARETGLEHIANLKSDFVIAELERFAALVEQRVRSEIALEEPAKISQELGGY